MSYHFVKRLCSNLNILGKMLLNYIYPSEYTQYVWNDSSYFL